MKFRAISPKQMHACIFMYMLGDALISGGTFFTQQDAWFAYLVGVLVSLPMLWVYSKILDFSPDRNFFGAVTQVFGEVLGRIVCLIYILYFLFVGAYVLRLCTEFIHLVNMPETPPTAIMACLIFAAAFIIKRRIYTMSRVARFGMFVMIFTVSLTVVLSIPNMNLDNLKPVLSSEPSLLASGSLFIFTLSSETLLCIPMFSALDKKEKVMPIFFKGFLIGAFWLIIAKMRNILVLGSCIKLFAFPSYEAVSTISYGEFFTRIEVLIGINLLLAGVLKICILIYDTCAGISRIFNMADYTSFTASASMLVFVMALFISHNAQELFSWLIYHPYFAPLFQILLPLIILIVGKIRVGRQGGKHPEPKMVDPKEPAVSAVKDG